MANLFKVDRRIILLIVLVLIAVGVTLFYMFPKGIGRKAPETSTESTELQPPPPPPPPGFSQVMEISGWVSDVNVSKNSFAITSRRDETYEVLLGEKTELKEYIIPTFFSQDSPNTSLEQIVPITLQKLKRGDQVSIIASFPIYFGKPIEKPVEIQVFR